MVTGELETLVRVKFFNLYYYFSVYNTSLAIQKFNFIHEFISMDAKGFYE